MTKKYTVTSPDGHTYSVEAPDDASQDDVMRHVQQQHSQPTPQDDDAPSTPGTFAAGLAQGAVMDPIEGIGQLVERVPYLGAIPRFIGNSALGSLADRFRNYAQSTTAGQVGELGGAVGSMFIPLGGLARLAGFAGKASRAGEAAEAGLQGVRSAMKAGPYGYAGVREALDVGKAGKAAVGKELGIKVPGSTDPRTLGKYLPGEAKELPLAPSKARPAFETPNPPTVGAPTLGQRARLAASDAAAATGKRIKILSRKHPVITGAVRGAIGAGVQPVVGGADYWSEKEQQLAGGALMGAGAASPLIRKIARTAATHGAIHGLGAATLPGHGGWLHIPLHHLARRAAPLHGPATGRRFGPEAQRAAGAAWGQAQHQPERLPVHRDPKFADPQENR